MGVFPKLKPVAGLPKLFPNIDVFWFVVPKAGVPNPVDVVAGVPNPPNVEVAGLVPNKLLPVLVVEGWLNEKAVLVLFPKLKVGFAVPNKLPVWK